MIIRFLCLTLLLLSADLSAANLINNSEANGKLQNEFRYTGNLKHFQISQYMEDLTWNKCVKLSIKSYYITQNGQKKVSVGVIIGGSKDKAGFAVKPDTTYSFSVELKGTAPFASVRALQWSGKCDYHKDRKALKGSLGRVAVQNEWTVYKGTFRTTKNAKRAALFIRLWDEGKNGRINTKKTDYLLIDKIFVNEKKQSALKMPQTSSKAETVAKKAVNTRNTASAPVIDGRLNDQAWKNAPVQKGFVDYKTQTPAQADTEVKILSDNDNIYLAIKCLEPDMAKLQAKISGTAGKVWQDDVVEIFFSDGTLRQFVVSAGGGRWMNSGNRYGEWEAKVGKENACWTVEVRIPFRLLGWKTMPKPGDMVKFNVCRQRKPVNELSCWSPVHGNFHEVKNFGLLVIDSFNSNLTQEISKLNTELAALPANHGHGRKATAAELNKIPPQISSSVSAAKFLSLYSKLQSIKARLKYIKAGNRTFTVAMVPPTTNTAIPFTPNEAFAPQTEFSLRAAVNEYKPLALAVTNMTGKAAAYRVIVFSGLKDEIEVLGLKGFPSDKIVMREAVRVKDSDTSSHGLRLDPLPLMNQAYTITVPAKQSGLVWITFNCTNAKPGLYTGKVRVIPLSESAKYVLKGSWNYVGPMQDVPLSLEVLPIKLSKTPARPLWLMHRAGTESFFKSMIEHGNRVFQQSPWHFAFKFNQNGSIKDYSSDKAERNIHRHLMWAKKYNVKIRFLIGFNAYKVFKKIHAKQFKYGTPEWKNAWINWLKGVAMVMKRCGVNPHNCIVEIWDEPRLKDVDRVLLTSKLAKQADTGMQMQITFAAVQHKISFLKKLVDYIDIWCVWGGLFDDRDYKKFFMSIQKNPAKELWFYYCSTNLREPLYRYYRRHAWIGLNYKTSVIGLFTLINLPGYGGNSFKALATGGAVTYRSFDQCIPSVRYECLRLGMTDIQYMAKLKELADAAAGHGTSALVKEARELLVNGPYEVAVKQAYDSNIADRIRRKAIELILKMQKVAK